jgi:2-succinyl-6-hydroxy-2,4-cyclohexadiene-1-carboxylate synthase
MAIYALHGFLGSPSDWNGFFPTLHAPNLFEESPIPFWEWAESFNRKIIDSGNVLIGYSMGGRLALHALIENPSLWKAAIIISANPGIENESERFDRLHADKLWHDRFLHEPWEALMDAWNRQPIFVGDPLVRHEKDFSRQALAEAMLSWTVGKQDFLKPSIEELDIPILWIVGENDKKYVEIAKKIKLKNKKSKISIAPHAGHRVPWQSKIWFTKEVEKFL